MNRREALQIAGAVVSLSAAPLVTGADKPAAKRKTIAMLVYPDFTVLDLVGPHHVFSVLEGYEVQLVGKSTELVTSDTGLSVKPTLAIKDCPEELAVLFVPGGTTGTVVAMGDADILAFLKSRGAKSDYVTSVCTGSLVLGAAGLLRGYKATSHWVARDILKLLGAEPVDERVVFDRNRVTGGGVTAGIDFALALAARLKDESYAKSVQLLMEYSPSPPFKAGTPAEAGAELTMTLRDMGAPFLKSATAAATKAKVGW
jgi:cyclohexyl-isocyanide hydratase